MSKFIDKTGLLAIAKWLKKQLDSKLSIDTGGENYPYGYYSGEGTIKTAEELFNEHPGLDLEDYEDGSVDVTVNLTDEGILGPLPVNKGGTGAGDAATAAKNLKVLSLTGGNDLPECKEGNSIVTDHTELITSWAYNGFVGTDSTSKGTLYRRRVSAVAAYMQDKLAVASPTSKGFMSAADKAKLDSFGTKCSYTYDSSTRKLTLSNTPTSYNVYYRKSTGVLGQLTVTNNVTTIPDDASDVLEVIIVDTTSVNKDIVII